MKRETTGEKWLKAILDERKLGPEELELAKLAAEQLDAAEQAKKLLKKQGPLVKGRFGPKSNPAADIARKAGESFAKLCKALKAAGEEKRPAHRPGLHDKTWKRQTEAQEPDEWADFALPRAKPQ
jgi:hypothetical protein